jgi:hypothetical protein
VGELLPPALQGQNGREAVSRGPPLPPDGTDLLAGQALSHHADGRTGQAENPRDSGCQSCNLSQQSGSRRSGASVRLRVSDLGHSSPTPVSSLPRQIPGMLQPLPELGHRDSPRTPSLPYRLRVKLTQTQPGSRELATSLRVAPACPPYRPRAWGLCEEPLCAPGGTAPPGPHASTADPRAGKLSREGCGVRAVVTPSPYPVALGDLRVPSTPGHPHRPTGRPSRHSRYSGHLLDAVSSPFPPGRARMWRRTGAVRR